MLIDFYVKGVVDLVHVVVAPCIYVRSWLSVIFSFIWAESLRKCGYDKIERFIFLPRIGR